MDLHGLSSAAAAEQLRIHGPNKIDSGKSKSFAAQVLQALREPMLLLLVAAGAISYLIGDLFESAILTISLFLVVSIAVVQTRRSENAVAALRLLTPSKVRVIRDGTTQTIDRAEVVPGDILLVQSGERVAADGILVSDGRLEVDESILTGESIAVAKMAGDVVLAGTIATLGSGALEVTKTGTKSTLGAIGESISEQSEPRTELQREIDQLVRRVAIFAISTAVFVALTIVITRAELLQGALAGIAAAMALIPEEIPVVFSVFMALGALRLARNKVIVRSGPAIEALGSVDTICVDKTGTLTENRSRLIGATEDISKFGALASAALSSDPIDQEFRANFDVPADYRLVREYPLTNEFPAVCQVWDCGENSYTIALKGAPELVLKLTEQSPTESASWEAELERLALLGHRILGVARGQLSKEKPLPETIDEFDLEFVGFATFEDPVREGVSDAISALQGVGIRVLMMTGDHATTARTVAASVGLDEDGGVISGAELDDYTDSELLQKLTTTTICYRVQPHHKLRLVSLLRAQGRRVAMTGDGVNDAPALKNADVGIAMGKRGSDVAREASDLIIADDSFNSIAAGVFEGRRIFTNLRRAASYIIAIHVPIFAMTVLPLGNSLWPLVLLPAQIAVLELVIDPAASVAFESEPASKESKKAPPRDKSTKFLNRLLLLPAIIQGLGLFLGSASIYLWSIFSAHLPDQTRALTFSTIVLGNLALMLVNRSGEESLISTIRDRPNKASLVIFLVGLAMLALALYFDPLTRGLGLVPLGIQDLGLALAAALIGPIWFEGYKLFVRIRRQRRH